MDSDLDETTVRETAYFLWEHDGRPAGKEEEYWLRALEQSKRSRECQRLMEECPLGDPGRDET